MKDIGRDPMDPSIFIRGVSHNRLQLVINHAINFLSIFFSFLLRRANDALNKQVGIVTKLSQEY